MSSPAIKYEVDLERRRVVAIDRTGARTEADLATAEGFELVSRAWLQAGWDAKHVYTFSWLGRPIIQLPEDMIRFQEVVFDVKPDVIVETGIAHGGSLIYSASLLRLIHGEQKARVIGVDIEIRPHNRRALDEHPFRNDLVLIEGNAIAPEIVDKVKEHIPADARVMVVLDSCHEREHVLGELRAYGELVSQGSFIVATDGIMADLVSAPRSNPDWGENNPLRAVEDFLAENDDFEEVEPRWAFNESTGLSKPITYWPRAYLKRRS